MVTEEESNYRYLEKMSMRKILSNINNEDKTVSFSVERFIPQLEKLVTVTVEKNKKKELYENYLDAFYNAAEFLNHSGY